MRLLWTSPSSVSCATTAPRPRTAKVGRISWMARWAAAGADPVRVLGSQGQCPAESKGGSRAPSGQGALSRMPRHCWAEALKPAPLFHPVFCRPWLPWRARGARGFAARRGKAVQAAPPTRHASTRPAKPPRSGGLLCRCSGDSSITSTPHTSVSLVVVAFASITTRGAGHGGTRTPVIPAAW